MAVAIVQEGHIYEFDGSVTVTLGSNFTNGNMILAWCVEASSSSVTAPSGGGWTQVPSSSVTAGSGSYMSGAWYYRIAGASEGNTVTHAPGSGTSTGLQVYEISGMASAPDTAATSAAGSAATSLASSSVTGTTNGMVFVGFLCDGLPGASRSYSNAPVDDVAANVRVQSCHKETTGSYTTTLTTTNSTEKLSSAFNIPIAGTNATVSGTTVAGTTTQPSPAEQTGETVSGTTVAGTTDISDMGAQVDTTVSPDTVAASTTQPAPTVTTGSGQTVEPPTISGTGTLPTSTEQTGETVTPPTVSGSTTLPAPGIQSSSGTTVLPPTVSGTTTQPAPTVTTGSGQTVQPPTVDSTGTLPAPTVSGSQTGASSGVTGGVKVMGITKITSMIPF